MAIQTTNQKTSPYYESIEFNLTNGSTNYNVASNQATFLSVVGPTGPNNAYPGEVIIRTDQTISVRFNSILNMAITLTSTETAITWRGEVQNIFLTNNSGSTAAIKILCLP